MKKNILVWSLVVIILAACQSENDVKNEIQLALDQCILAVNTKDIDLYMQAIPDDFEIKDENGEIITREMQRNYALRDWAIIDSTLNNRYVIDSLKVSGDSAIAFTSQEWKRLMFQRDGASLDTVLTTQLHKEIWRKVSGHWRNYGIEELGGKIFINGKQYVQRKELPLFGKNKGI